MTSLKLLFGTHSSGYGGNDYVDYGAYTGGYGTFGYLSTTMQSTKMQPCHFENASGSICYLSYKQIIFSFSLVRLFTGHSIFPQFISLLVSEGCLLY